MSIDCFEERFISEFCDIMIFSCLLYTSLPILLSKENSSWFLFL